MGPIFALLRSDDTAVFEETSPWKRAVGNTVSNLTGRRFEPRTSRSRDERATARLNFLSGFYRPGFGFKSFFRFVPGLGLCFRAGFGVVLVGQFTTLHYSIAMYLLQEHSSRNILKWDQIFDIKILCFLLQ